MKYDYLVVGSGLYGITFGRAMREAGRTVLMIERENYFGGACQTKNIEGIEIHKSGPHIFHTNNKKIWDYVNQFSSFNNYQHHAKAIHDKKIYSLPFNLNTFYQLWGTSTPEEAKQEIERQKVKIDNPSNLEEWALSQVGPNVYYKLIYGFTKKQWKREPKDLPASILKRIPIRFNFNDNYFDDPYQGIPTNGYSELIENMADVLDIKLNVDFFDMKDPTALANKVIYSGPIDRLFRYELGDLEYRTLEFKHEILDMSDFQGTSVINYTNESVPYTRITEHKHFSGVRADKTVITYEYPTEWARHKIPYYPVNDDKNNALYDQYKNKLKENTNILVGGRLGRYQYFNMDGTIASALEASKKELAE